MPGSVTCLRWRRRFRPSGRSWPACRRENRDYRRNVRHAEDKRSDAQEWRRACKAHRDLFGRDRQLRRSRDAGRTSSSCSKRSTWRHIKFDPDATPQIAIYDDGVGTEKFKPLKILSGATGWGLSRNVKHLYKELARIYDPGDDIYMFGFSRGAFTVRTLVGFIQTCGLVDPERLQPQDVRAAAAGGEQRLQGLPAVLSAQAVADAVRGEDRRERGIQTGALAALRYPDPVPRRLGHGRRGGPPVPAERRDQRDAVSVQVLRPQAQPPRAARLSGARHRRAAGIVRAAALGRGSQDRARIQQVWFAGAHSNVGGGYPKQGMSLVALDWLLSQAERPLEPTSQGSRALEAARGLRICASERQSFREHASVDDKLYDPRSGAGIFYRWKIRDIEELCAANNVKPRVHVSVLERDRARNRRLLAWQPPSPCRSRVHAAAKGW